MKHLLTVTCIRDIKHMLLQAESLSYLTEPITHTVIIDTGSIDKWTQCLEPYYTVHTLQLIAAPKLNTSWANHGWRRQQAYKLLAYKYINDRYLIIDSQNFFIRPTSLSLWHGIHGRGYYNNIPCENLTDIQSITVDTIKTYSLHLGLPLVYRMHSDGVPFAIDSQVMNQYDIDAVVDEFIHQQCVPIEFIFYLLLAQKVNYCGRMLTKPSLSATVRTADQIFPHPDWEHCALAGIHRTFLQLSKNRKLVDQWLEQKGFKQRLCD